MASSSKVKFTLLASEWGSKRGGLSTFNRILAIELAKHSKAHVSVFVPQCNQEEVDDALSNNIKLVQASRKAAFEERDWLMFPPEDLQIDIVIGHGVVLGRQAQIIKESRRCKWIQFVHTDPEELGMFKNYSEPIVKGEQKHKDEVELCVLADFVVAVGPKLGEAYRSYLKFCRKDQKVFVLTPGIFSEFSSVKQATQDGKKCRVLAFGRGDAEDFELKGFDIAAKAVGKLKNANLIFVGAGNKKQDEVADNLKQCDIPPSRLRVRTFLESREELKHLFYGVDLAIMPSRTEGFGLTALEALSAGLPILVGENSGFAEALSEVALGSSCVIPSEDPVEWAEAIERVWRKNREVRLKESDMLRTSYAQKYDWEKQCNDLVEIAKNIVTEVSAPDLKRKASNSSSKDPGESASKSRKLSDRSSTQKPEQTTLEVMEKEDEPLTKQRSNKGEETTSNTQKTSGTSADEYAEPSSETKQIADSKSAKTKVEEKYFSDHSVRKTPATEVKAEQQKACKGVSEKQSEAASEKYSESDPLQSKSTSQPAGNLRVKADCPSMDELEALSKKLGGQWKALGRRLGFQPAEIAEFDEGSKKLSSKALEMLTSWKDKKGLDATYQVLYDALCHEFVALKSVAEEVCCEKIGASLGCD